LYTHPRWRTEERGRTGEPSVDRIAKLEQADYAGIYDPSGRLRSHQFMKKLDFLEKKNLKEFKKKIPIKGVRI